MVSDLAVDAQGNVLVAGHSRGSGTYHDFATIKYNPDGKRLWVRRYNGKGNERDEPNAMALDTQGNVYVSGSSWSGTNYDYATIKYNPDGQRLWLRRYTGRGAPHSIAVDGQGNVYIAGYSYASGTDPDFLTIKYTHTP